MPERAAARAVPFGVLRARKAAAPAQAVLDHVARRVFAEVPFAFCVKVAGHEPTRLHRGEPAFTLVLRSPAVLAALARQPHALALAQAYFTGELDIEGSIYDALALRHHLRGRHLGWLARWQLARAVGRLQGTAATAGAVARGEDARRRARREGRHEDAIAFHYDVSNDFYRVFLDPEMVYSCAYFDHPADDLAAAQRNKLEHICRKLRLTPGERFLDVGSGWGALAIWAARHHGVHATGITLSRRQYDFARARVAREGLADRVEIALADYRAFAAAHPESSFDKVASVGMFEHVGLDALPGYFGAIHRLLVPGGLFLNHGITHEEEGWGERLSTVFVNRYVFPDGELDTLGNVLRQMERGHFEVWDVEGLRPHYARTLRAWVARLEAGRDEALAHVAEEVYRVWRLYMAASALEFEAGGVGIYQVLGSKRAGGTVPVPMTRRDLYLR